jgi:hypothetical protein
MESVDPVIGAQSQVIAAQTFRPLAVNSALSEFRFDLSGVFGTIVSREAAFSHEVTAESPAGSVNL